MDDFRKACCNFQKTKIKYIVLHDACTKIRLLKDYEDWNVVSPSSGLRQTLQGAGKTCLK